MHTHGTHAYTQAQTQAQTQTQTQTQEDTKIPRKKSRRRNAHASGQAMWETLNSCGTVRSVKRTISGNQLSRSPRQPSRGNEKASDISFSCPRRCKMYVTNQKGVIVTRKRMQTSETNTSLTHINMKMKRPYCRNPHSKRQRQTPGPGVRARRW